MPDNQINENLVNGQAFNDTFGNPGATMVGVIVAIYEGKSSFEPRRPSPL